MNFQKNLFFNQWKKSIKRNKYVVAIYDKKPFEIMITFSKMKRLHHNIRMWLMYNNYDFDDLENIYNGWTTIVIKCPF